MIIKRIFDITVSFFLLLLFLPLLILIFILIRRYLGHPVFFVQPRPGLHGKVFLMIKFRTMLDSKDAAGNILPDEKRVTKFGLFLRSTSLDELPEFINVLKGDMSLVGPRPLLVDYLPLYSAEQMRRHDVLPGITGWAQVNGRNAITWEDKFKYDIWYVEHRSFWLDIKILFLTLIKVLQRKEISSKTSVTVERFMGNKTDR